MTKILINTCYGGFSLSDAAVLKIRELGGNWCITPPIKGETWPCGTLETFGAGCHAVDRSSPLVLAAVEAIGLAAASGQFAELAIVEIPDDVIWQIEEYDGMEWVAEAHRIWRV